MRSILIASVVVAANALTALPVHAQTAPLSNVASPDVYKVLKENAELRMVLATWKPGQRDELHSHPVTATYALTPCRARLYGADGKVLGEPVMPQGTSVLQPVIAAHSFENIGASECQILIIERK